MAEIAAKATVIVSGHALATKEEEAEGQHLRTQHARARRQAQQIGGRGARAGRLGGRVRVDNWRHHDAIGHVVGTKGLAHVLKATAVARARRIDEGVRPLAEAVARRMQRERAQQRAALRGRTEVARDLIIACGRR